MNLTHLSSIGADFSTSVSNSFSAAKNSVVNSFNRSVSWIVETSNANPLVAVFTANAALATASATITNLFVNLIFGKDEVVVVKAATDTEAEETETKGSVRRHLLIGTVTVLTAAAANYALLPALGLSITTLPVALTVGAGFATGLAIFLLGKEFFNRQAAKRADAKVEEVAARNVAARDFLGTFNQLSEEAQFNFVANHIFDKLSSSERDEVLAKSVEAVEAQRLVAAEEAKKAAAAKKVEDAKTEADNKKAELEAEEAKLTALTAEINLSQTIYDGLNKKLTTKKQTTLTKPLENLNQAKEALAPVVAAQNAVAKVDAELAAAKAAVAGLAADAEQSAKDAANKRVRDLEADKIAADQALANLAQTKADAETAIKPYQDAYDAAAKKIQDKEVKLARKQTSLDAKIVDKTNLEKTVADLKAAHEAAVKAHEEAVKELEAPVTIDASTIPAV